MKATEKTVKRGIYNRVPVDGATGLIKFFMSEILDSWERKIIDNCKPLN